MRKQGILEKRSRTVVPRWRPFLEATRVDASLTSLRGSAGMEPHEDQQKDAILYERDIKDFRREQTVWFAGDLLVSAISRNDTATASEVAEFVLKQPGTTNTLRSVAESFLANEVGGDDGSHDGNKRAVRSVRALIQTYPRNGIAWADLAYYLNLMGKSRAADRAMRTAVQLSPENRFVLRSASRFYIHCGEYDRAHDLLRRSEATPSDPWLLSAEIAAATAADRRSQMIRTARSMVKDGRYHPRHTSELASAIATAELDVESTPRKQVRSMFEAALQSPTENALAQAEWASRVDSSVAQRPDLRGRIDVHEARTWDSFVAGQFHEAVASAEKWFLDQPFSARPPLLMSWILSTVLDEYAQAVTVLKRAVGPNPDDPMILNNLAFAYAHVDELEAAQTYLARAREYAGDDEQRLFVDATSGLLAYRNGRPEEGRRRYLDVIHRARALQGDPRIEAMAWSHFAREEVRAQSKFASIAIKSAMDQAARADSPDVHMVMNHLRPTFESHLAVSGDLCEHT